MHAISEGNFQDKRVLMRVDFNVPLDEQGNITDDIRIRGALPSIRYILEGGGSVVLMSHLGRPKGEAKPALSLAQVVDHLGELLGLQVKFAGDCVSEAAFAVTGALQPGEVALLENLRYHGEETKGDRKFAEKLALHGEIYVNDAFGTAHRAHASTAIVAEFFPEKYAGFLMTAEVENARKVMENVERPFTAIMGGAKVSDKIQIIQRLLDKVDYLLIGGGMAYTFLKAKGYDIGNSLLEADKVALAAALIKKARNKGVIMLVPVDSVVANKFAEDAETAVVRNDQIPSDMMGLDIGPQTFKAFYEIIMKSKTVMWNGPMGVFEMAPFAQGTVAMAQTLAEATKAGAYTLVGGGDSAAAIKKAGLESEVSYVSTGGGALLEMLEGKELPGVAALGGA
ncbi:MAG TPA: phosphoglycerate kinase [Bacteroidetes bacterium]|nr:phosphoglycerate kinase [Bacteroidota bacterium]